jgi:hypothetical protein
MYSLPVFSGLGENKSPSPHHILKGLASIGRPLQDTLGSHCSGLPEEKRLSAWCLSLSACRKQSAYARGERKYRRSGLHSLAEKANGGSRFGSVVPNVTR